MQIFYLYFLAIGFLGFQFLKVESARILIFAYHDTGSHFMSMSPFFTKLADSGHQIFLFDTIFNKTQFVHRNITHLDFTLPRHITNSEFIWNTYVDSLMALGPFTYYDKHVSGPLLEKYPKELNQLLGQKWDLIISDALFVPYAHAFSLRALQEQETPLLIYETACELEEWQMNMQGMAWNPVIKPYAYLDPSTVPNKHYDPQQFFDRLWTFMNSFLTTFSYYYLEISTYYPNIEKFGVDNFRYWDFFQTPVLTFAERIDWMGWIMPISKTLIDIGYHCPKVSASKLTEELKEFIEKPGSKGTIYIAFGSYANWTAALPNVVDAFKYTFQRIPPSYQIIFSYNGPVEKMPTLPNLKLIKWAPQTDILRHPNTKLFVSHSGLKSAKEAICAGTPILALPLYAEQPHTSDSVVKQQIGTVLHKHKVNGEQMFAQVTELLGNPKYTQNIQRFRKINTDRIITPMELANWHTEKTLRSSHKHFKLTKKKGATMPWLNYLIFDVFGLFLIAVMFCA